MRRRKCRRRNLGFIKNERNAVTGVNQSIQNLRNAVIFSSLGLATSAGAFFLIRYLYKKSRTNAAEKKSLEEGNPATFAKQLKMAFQNDNWLGWGTNTDMVYQVFNQIPSKASYQKVQKAYFDLYKTNLNSDLESELSSGEYNEVIQILSGKKLR